MKNILIVVGLIFLMSFSSEIHLKPDIGEQAPEIILTNHQGKEIKLSQLRGKLVMIDFWASWCRTCRLENKNIVRAYERFKNSSFVDGEGFEVFSVSLDEKKDLWVQAIENDKMSWEYHGCDFKKWDGKAVKDYSFKHLPHNLLINKNGKVIAKSIFGNNIEKELQSRLK
jgi:thiol-disulfide isomerase/thioredoxin